MVRTKPSANALSLATEIVAAYASSNKVSHVELPKLLMEVHDAIKGIETDLKHHRGEQKPAISISKSISTDYLICLEDGKKLRMLKRYLASGHW